MRLIRFLLILLILLRCLNAVAQTHIGISVNIGNRQQFTPDSDGLERSALAPAGSLFINQKRAINKDWNVQYGATVGVVAYNLKTIAIDTLTPQGDVSPFPDYSTLFGSADLLVGREFLIRKRNVMVGAGGGVTFYASAIPINRMGVHIGYPDGTLVTVFEARMTAPANTFSLFWKLAAYYDISASFVVGAEYVHHTKPAAHGTYTFYHTKTPQSGNIEVYQQEFRLALSYKLR